MPMHFIHRFDRLHMRLADSPQGEAGSGGGQSGPEAGPDQGAEKDQESKEFSRALSKRAAEIRAKYSDYDELKAKAAKLDEIEEAQKSELDKLREQAEKAEHERDELKAARERDRLVGDIAKETGLDRSVVEMLAGDGEQLREHAQAIAKTIGETRKQQADKSGLPPANPLPAYIHAADMSPSQMIAGAYADK